MLKNRLTLLAAALGVSLLASAGNVYNDKHVRISLISDGAVRLEYAPDGKFVDAPSFLAVERDYTDVPAKTVDDAGWLVVTTSDMELRYKKNSGKFTDKNLSIKSLRPDAKFTWHPGDKQTANLKGTYRTLDGYDGEYNNGKPMPIEDGLLAKDGWTLLDDSDNMLFDDSEWSWATERKSGKNAQDWYFMVYGKDYKKALNDFTKFAGKVPMPPRYAFGYWWSRYWCYSDNELRDVVDNFHSYGIPLDVLVIDMDWHYTEHGKGGWTGYTWNRSLFPDPQGLLKFIKDNNLQITMNLHPADGIANYEEKYPQMREWMGFDSNYTSTIPFQASSKQFMTGWLNTILHPMEADGVDFWWLDWQQHPFDTKLKNLSNTWWLNYTFFTDMQRNGTVRPMLYHRWGGLGNHRYQIGFSGDSSISWASLDFQPYFNSTASNVLYGYWSHDIGGHHFGIGRIEPEMYIRWMQFGAYSPILRSHSTKNENLTKEPWVFDKEQFRILKNIITGRYDMSPYIYTMARNCYDTGLSICRPMYYDYPDKEQSYSYRNEYMFGDNILVMPITKPMEGMYSVQKVWLPEGSDWYELHSGTMLRGGQEVERRFALDEYPVYVKAGSIIPKAPGLQSMKPNDFAYELNVYPGEGGEFSIYEDNGNDKDYAGNYATTKVSSVHKGNTLSVKIEPRQGSYPDMPARRDLSLKVNGFVPPVSVSVNGKPVESEYDGITQALTVKLPEANPEMAHEIAVVYPDGDHYVPDGTLAKFRRITRSSINLKYKHAGILFKEPFAMLESAGRNITYHPENYREIMDGFSTNYANLPEILRTVDTKDENKEWFLQSIDWGK